MIDRTGLGHGSVYATWNDCHGTAVVNDDRPAIYEYDICPACGCTLEDSNERVPGVWFTGCPGCDRSWVFMADYQAEQAFKAYQMKNEVALESAAERIY